MAKPTTNTVKTERRERRKYRNVIRAVHGAVWAMEEEKVQAIQDLLELRSTGARMTREVIASRIGDRKDKRVQVTAPRIAMIGVNGALTPKINMMSEISGGTSMEQLQDAIRTAEADDTVTSIVLNIDSEGGEAQLVQETAELIQEADKKKPVYAFVNVLAASGAYWLASAAREIWVTPSGLAGSVGVLMIHTDLSEAKEKAGIKTDIIRIPKTKAEGAAGEALSDPALKAKEDLALSFYVPFSEFVSDRRSVSLTTVRDEFGRVYGSQRALELGMVDKIGTLDELLAELGSGRDTGALTAQEDRPAFSLEDVSMKAEIFGALVRIGMCQITANDSEANHALAKFFAVRSKSQPEDEDAVLSELTTYIRERDTASTVTTAIPAAITPADVPTGTSPAAPEARVDETRTKQIMAAVRIASLPESTDRLQLAQGLIDDQSVSLEDALGKIQDLVAANSVQPGASAIRGGESQREKFYEEARDAVLQRSFGGRTPGAIWSNREQDYVDWAPSAGSRNNRSLRSLTRLAEECLVNAGVPRETVMRQEPMNVALMAMGLKDPHSLGIYAASDGPAYNLSGMFSNILIDAQNVTLRDAYRETDVTFTVWARQGESVPDFKTVNKVIGGELPDPKAVPEDGEFEEVTYADSKETYSLTVWGEIFSISWQAVVNDQLGEFMAIPQKQGRAMRRKQNKLVYGILNDNATLVADSIALFDNATHDNLTTGAVTDYTTAFNTMYTKMAEQAGITSGTTLNLQPKYVLFPPTLRGEMLKMLRSSADPFDGGSNVGNSGSANIWRGSLEPVADAQMNNASGGSETQFFFAADPNDVDTVEYAYLQGLETPALDQVEGFQQLAIRYRIYQAFAAKAIDYRGLQKHAGV